MSAAGLFVGWTPLASHAVETWLDQFDFDTSPDPLCDWLYGEPDGLGGVRHGSAELILGAAPVRPVGHDLFDVDPDGSAWAVLQPVAPDGETILDVIAWHPCAPDRWRFLAGHGEALGEREIELRQDRDGPVRVFATPWSWHRAGGRGVCLLCQDWEVAQRVFMGERELIVETVELGEWVDWALRFRPSPAIYVHYRERAA